MPENCAEKFLSDYKSKSQPLLKNYLNQKLHESSLIGKIPAKTTQSFSELALRGKKIRGALTVLGYRLAGGTDQKQILKASLSMEIYHASLLVHDDIMDNAPTRRSLESLHKQFSNLSTQTNTSQKENFGKSLAICIGDKAFFLALENLTLCNFSSNHLLAACKIFSHYAILLTDGQSLDLVFNQEKNVQEKDILKLMYLKSGAYTSELPFLMGAALAGGLKKEKLIALKKYAESLGWIFQIQDDILGIFGNQKKTGKPNTSDLKEGKMTLLMLHLEKNGNPQQKQIQKKILGNKNIKTKDVLLMRKILKESGSHDYVINLAKKYIKTGKQQIHKITTNPKQQKLLENFLEFMLSRTR